MNDTIIAPITPMITAPVITVRISGPDASKVFSLMKTSSGKIPDFQPNMMKKYIFEIEKDKLNDDVMVVYFKSPNSFTGEDVVEISFHGNPILVRAALSAIYKLGIRNAEPGEFSKRAFLNGKCDLTQAEAIQELIAARSETGLYHAYNQLNGFIRGKFDVMKNDLLDIKAMIEAQIDFPDEETAEEKDIIPNIKKVIKECDSLIDSYHSLRKQDKGVSIVIAGKPNVGKSSLLNALLKTDRAIVSEKPGTTRDYISEDLYIGSLPVSLIDTAGVRFTDDEIENEGVKRSAAKINDADIVLVVVDLAGMIDKDDAKILEMTEKKNRIIIGNKSDSYQDYYFIPSDIIVSSKNNENIDQLIDIIKDKTSVVDSDIFSNVISVTERHTHSLTKIKEILNSVIDNFNSKTYDMICMDIEECISLIQEITGEKYTEEVLSRIFNKFCIGK